MTTTEYDTQLIRNYYEHTASGAYERWGGPSLALHLGYFEHPEEVQFVSPADIQMNHLLSLQRMADYISQTVNPEPGAIVIDAGCGTGSMLEPLSSRGATVLGVNIIPYHLTRANQHIRDKGIHTAYPLLADYSRLPQANERVDHVVFVESICHSPNLEKTLEEAYRVLRTGGNIVITEPVIWHYRAGLGDEVLKRVQEVDTGMILHLTSHPELLDTLTSLGFTVETDDITTHVLPSLELAARSAEEHLGEPDTPQDVVSHRLATIACRDLLEAGCMGYMIYIATK